MITIGVDPGLHGAIAVYDAAYSSIVEILDMPIYTRPVSGNARGQLDVPQLHHEVGKLVRAYGSGLVTIEDVSSRPNDGAVPAFAFGWVCGVTYGAFSGYRFRIERVRPQVWKKASRIPAAVKGMTKKEVKALSVARANELFPESRHLWLGPRGGALADRAEAAMIAKYGAETYGR